ncbi:Hint domain-containing protein [Loktanella sp. Alg231-35]|uniref:Hint domain-containing protein n=1 Tax=Loktanella sp. Alg231-35 TaxID=1922220 RepID=UPI001F269F56|nr:Hint domain-containing protein [Loktanella sp. Alg231-35]
MPTFSINDGDSTTFTDTTPGGGFVIDFITLDNSLSVQINGVDLFVGGPAGAPNELEFQAPATAGQTVRFSDGDMYEADTPAIWQLENTNGGSVFRLEVDPDGTVTLSGAKTDNGPLEPLELFNGLSVNTAAIDAAWNESGPNTIVVDQIVTGPTNASGDFTDVPCFASGTMIETLQGPVRVEDLQIEDQVHTYDHGYKPIRWIGSCDLSQSQLQANPKLKPIVIRADALGAGYPKQDLIVSPQHRVLVSSVIAMRMFDSRDVLIPANKLLSLSGVEISEDSPDGVEYWHILFDDHEVIWSNGASTESLHLGPEALKAVSLDARVEIQSLFPEICSADFKPVSARHIPEKGRMMKQLVQRHQANNKPLFCSM